MVTHNKHEKVKDVYNRPFTIGQESKVKWHIVTSWEHQVGLAVREVAGSNPTETHNYKKLRKLDTSNYWSSKSNIC